VGVVVDMENNYRRSVFIIRREEKYPKVLHRRTNVSYAVGGLMYRQGHISLPLLSVIRPKISKSTPVTGTLPIRISQP